LSTATGTVVGGLLKTVGEWKLREVQRFGASSRKYVCLGRYRVRVWVYVCCAVVSTLSLSLLASVAPKNGYLIVPNAYLYFDGSSGSEPLVPYYYLACDHSWLGVVVAMCIINFAAVVAGAIIRHKLRAQCDRQLLEEARKEQWRNEKLMLSTAA
jgi:hypothetical protein